MQQIRIQQIKQETIFYKTSICQGTSGKKNWNNYWLQENAKKRKTMMDKWLKDPASVGDASTSGGEVKILAIFNDHNFEVRIIPGHS